MSAKHNPILIAGAGPGDPELVTVRLVNALRHAEIILVDRLVNPEILKRYVPEHAIIIPVGKQGHQPDSVPQEDINSLLVHYALSGKKVIRLKGGDVAIYSNVLSEIETLRAHQISYEIIPGITAASGAAAGMNIPLTARGHSSGVQFLTLPPGKNIPDTDLQRWAGSPDTLVFYMSIAPLKELVTGLLNFGADPTLPIALVEEATTVAQKVTVFNLETILSDCDTASLKTPALLIIGRVLDALDKSGIKSHSGAASPFNSLIPPSINTALHVI